VRASIYIWLASIGSHLSSSSHSRVNDRARAKNKAVQGRGCLCCIVSGSCSQEFCLATCFEVFTYQEACQSISGYLCNAVAKSFTKHASFALQFLPRSMLSFFASGVFYSLDIQHVTV